MAAILMMSAILATLGLLKIKVFWRKGYDVIILSMMSPSKFYDVTEILLQNWLCGSSLVTLAFLKQKSNVNFIRIRSEKQIFVMGALDWHRFDLEVSRQCGKSVKSKSQKVFGANSYVYRSSRGKTGREEGGVFSPQT